LATSGKLKVVEVYFHTQSNGYIIYMKPTSFYQTLMMSIHRGFKISYFKSL